MAIPTRDGMVAEANYEFATRHPDAPKELNLHDPAQAHLVQAWHEIYTRLLNLKVDEIFFSFYPHAPNQLDPGEPSHAQLIEFWNDIRNRIEHGTSRWNWEAGQVAPEDPFRSPTRWTRASSRSSSTTCSATLCTCPPRWS